MKQRSVAAVSDDVAHPATRPAVRYGAGPIRNNRERATRRREGGFRSAHAMDRGAALLTRKHALAQPAKAHEILPEPCLPSNLKLTKRTYGGTPRETWMPLSRRAIIDPELHFAG